MFSLSPMWLLCEMQPHGLGLLAAFLLLGQSAMSLSCSCVASDTRMCATRRWTPLWTKTRLLYLAQWVRPLTHCRAHCTRFWCIGHQVQAPSAAAEAVCDHVSMQWMRKAPDTSWNYRGGFLWGKHRCSAAHLLPILMLVACLCTPCSVCLYLTLSYLRLYVNQPHWAWNQTRSLQASSDTGQEHKGTNKPKPQS